MANPYSAYGPMMTSLVQKRDRLREELRAVESAIEALRAAQNVVSRGAGETMAADTTASPPPETTALALEPAIFNNMTMPQAVFEALKRTGKALV